MAFCSNCGAKLEDGAGFCPACGAKQAAEAKAVQPAETPKAATGNVTKAKKDNNSLIGIIAVAVVALLVIFLGVKLFGSNYKTPLKKAAKSFNRQTTDVMDYMGALPKFVKSAYKDGMSLIGDLDKDVRKEAESHIKDTLKDFYDSAEDEYGRNVKLSFKVTEKEKLDKDELEELQNGYSGIVDALESYGVDLTDKDTYTELLEDSDFSKSDIKKVANFGKSLAKELKNVKITKGYRLTVDLTLKGKDDEDTLEDVELYVVKMNGKWCIEAFSALQTVTGESVNGLISDLIRYGF